MNSVVKNLSKIIYIVFLEDNINVKDVKNWSALNVGLTNKLFLAILMTNNIGFAKFAIKTLFIVKFSKKEITYNGTQHQ